jgi:hypothetical protein
MGYPNTYALYLKTLKCRFWKTQERGSDILETKRWAEVRILEAQMDLGGYPHFGSLNDVKGFVF